MGIVKISDELHEKVRLCSKAMTRSINAQAEHWMKIGKLIEENPTMTYQQVCKVLVEEAQREDFPILKEVVK